ncbi:unnamed protein product [Rotaria sp. Silwood1]|nr:unnamed protein product [Rotaria sp. Silwood1]CAF3747450.1 unnamed protein product [Rotaria sp. Silwood1]CAF4786475.1 unnamed protein product [Rotaria sp. Silwood1]CAF4837086.1 unnamed protein product [Rotaria sp. Silwood1]
MPGSYFEVIGQVDPAVGLHIIHLKEIDPPFPLVKPPFVKTTASAIATQVAPPKKEQPSTASTNKPPASQKPLECKGHPCSECGNCSDWYFTGDPETWNWIRDWQHWNKNDYDRWFKDHVDERFKRRDGATCTYVSKVHGGFSVGNHHDVDGVLVGDHHPIHGRRGSFHQNGDHHYYYGDTFVLCLCKLGK